MTIVTIQTGTRSSAQGPRLAQHPDGRVTISTGRGTLTGWPIARLTPARLTPMGL
ncbi:hypothetical protein PANO111632_02865 [Paracoccus nototheniae]|uniref:Uncharacterized protein n=1 Tax=Paracoccus nototheniae TaxID=2489002 RepID=A0ABW4DVZ6_9RHOB|nr:hypothetical protein [Paracoccus nototheniae]